MSNPKGNVVMAGDKVYAGIDEDDRSEVSNALVIEFKNPEEFHKAVKACKVEFTLFEGE